METTIKIHKMRLIQNLIFGAFVFLAAAPRATLGADMTVNSFSAFEGQSDIRLQASGNITFSGGSLRLPALPPGASNGHLSVQAGNNIVVPDGVTISAGPGWSLSFLAGVGSTALNGAVENHGRIVAGGGTVLLQARDIGQSGLIQANSAGHQRGTIELLASENIQLAGTSLIQASGDDSDPGDGGRIVIKSGGTFSDGAGSRITAAGGANGGNGGNVEVSAPGVLSLNSHIDAGARPGWSEGLFALDPENIVLGTSGTISAGTNGVIMATNSSGSVNVNVESAFQNINAAILLEATGNITLNGNTTWNLSASTGKTSGQLTLEAGGNVLLNNGSMIQDAGNWSVALEAGYDGNGVSSGVGTVTLEGNAGIKTAAGSITVVAGENVTVGSGGIVTKTGGDVNVQAVSGNVNCGSSTAGYIFGTSGYTVNPGLGGISTASGGDVTIQAGGDITAPLAEGTLLGSTAEYGSGSFGPTPGNVTLTAGGNVTGHYVLANGVGTITCANAGTTAQNLALSLIAGEWVVDATNNIFLQEARNPNGVFNSFPPSEYLFNYDPFASVVLDAGNGVTITGFALPRISGANEGLVFPPSLTIEAGAGGIALEQNLSLFPSPQGTLELTTTGGGNLSGSATGNSICISDSTRVQWVNPACFTPTDSLVNALLHLDDTNAALINISGAVSDFTLYSPKPVEMNAANNIIDSGATIENFFPTNTSIVSAGGEILDHSPFVIVTLPSGQTPDFDALDAVSEPTIESGTNTIANPNLIPALVNQQNQFVYDATTGNLLYEGTMSSAAEQAFLAMTTPFVPATNIEQIYTQSQSSSTGTASGYNVAGPGTFRINAASLDLGDSGGVVSLGIAGYPALAPYTSRGADIDISLGGNLNLLASAIESQFGGNINVTSGGSVNVGSTLVPSFGNERCLGIASLWSGNINVTAAGDVDVSGSPIASYDGGNVVVESLNGNVNVGSGCSGESLLQKPYMNAQTNLAYLTDDIPGGGLMAITLPEMVYGQTTPQIGNITVSAAQSIQLGSGAIIQFPLGTAAGVPKLTLNSGGPLVLTGGSCESALLDLQAGAVLIASSLSMSNAGPPYVFEAALNVTNLTVEAGTNVQFTVTDGSGLRSGGGEFIITHGIGIEPPTAIVVSVFNCQWFKNGTNRPGEMGTSLSLTNVHRADSGVYSVVVSTVWTGASSNQAQLRVVAPELMTISPAQTNSLSISFDDPDGSPLTAGDIPRFVIQTSTNLVDWIPANLPVSTNANGSLSFSPPLSADSGQAFFRILSPAIQTVGEGLVTPRRRGAFGLAGI